MDGIAARQSRNGAGGFAAVAAPQPAVLAPSPTLLDSPRKAWAVLLLIFLAVYGSALFSPSLLDDADATHAQAARHIADTGDWVTLYVNGVRYLEKPPLPYWLVALAYRVCGANVFATHLPMALAVLANGVLAWVWARRAWGDRAAFYAALLLFTTVGVFLFTRFFIPESELTFFLALALWAFLTSFEDRKPRRMYLAWASLALALLTKGLIAPVFFAAAVGAYLLLTGEWRRWRELRLASGLLVFLAIGAPWHILAALANPDHGHPVGNVPSPGHVHGFLYFYFINEHVLRFLGRRYPHDYNKQPPWVFWAGHFAWLFPWCLFLPAAALRWWQGRAAFLAQLFPDRLRGRTLVAEHPTAFHAAFAVRGERFRARTTVLLGTYAAFILLFFSFSTNQEYYTFPAYFPLLVLLAGSLSTLERPSLGPRPTLGWVMGAHWVLVGLGLTSSAALLFGLWSARGIPYVPDIGDLLAHRGVGGYSLSTSHLFDLTGQSFAALRLPAALALVALGLGPWLALRLRRRGHAFESTASIGLMMAAFLVAAHIALVRFEPLLSSKSMAEIINSAHDPGSRLLVYGDQANASSVVFYSHKQALLVNGRSTSMLWGSDYPDAPRIFLDDADLSQMWRGVGPRLYLVLPASEEPHVRTLLAGRPMVRLEQLSDRSLWSNR